MKSICFLMLFISTLCLGQSNKTEMKNSIGLQISIFDLAPLIRYERLVAHLPEKTQLTTDIHFIYEWQGNMVFLPVNCNLKFGNKLKAILGAGVSNYFDFSPFPASREERDAWVPTGGMWISYPYNIRPDFITGIEYDFGRISVSLKSFNVAYFYRKYNVTEEMEPENEIFPIYTCGIDYKF